MRIFDRVVQSNTEPSIHSLWIRGNDILYFGRNGWTGLDFSKNTELKNMLDEEIKNRKEGDISLQEALNQEIKNRENADQEIKDTYLPLTGGTLTGKLTIQYPEFYMSFRDLGAFEISLNNQMASIARGDRIASMHLNYMEVRNRSTKNFSRISSEEFNLKEGDGVGDPYLTLKRGGIQLKDKTASDILTAAASTVKISTINGTPIMINGERDFKLAPLENNLVPAAYLPSYVDDVLEFTTIDSFPETGESGKIYVDTTTNLTYRWTGTQYIEVSKSIGLGTSAADAYPGNLGQQNADNIASLQGDITDINQVIEGLGNTYATKGELDNYLPLTGGVLTGSFGYVKALDDTSYGNAVSIGEIPNNDGNDTGIAIVADNPTLEGGFVVLKEDGLYCNLQQTLNFEDGTHYGIKGVTLAGKSNQDLLNAAGGTTSISDITSNLATKDEVTEAIGNIDLTPYATKKDLGDYLPLSGGTMSGGINFETVFDTENLPDGLSIVDEQGNIYPNGEGWAQDKGYTGIGISKDGHKFVIAIADNIQDINADDMSINTRKLWSSVLHNIDVPNLKNITNTDVVENFSSKENTDAIIAALATSSNPKETNNAAVVCRNYSKGVIGKGQWDFPAMGILNIIYQFKNQLIPLVQEILGNNSWDYLMTNNVLSNNEFNSNYCWFFNYNDNDDFYIASYGTKGSSNFVIPVYTSKTNPIITIQGKSSNDLLNAGGSTTPISDIISQVTVPTKISELTNDSGYQTEAQVAAKVSSLVDSAPETLDTLNELAAALNDDPNFATTITTELGKKANITSLPGHYVSDILVDAYYTTDRVTIQHNYVPLEDNGEYGSPTSSQTAINAATATTAGVLSATDFQKLSDVTLGTRGISKIKLDAAGSDAASIYSEVDDSGNFDGHEKTTLVLQVEDNADTQDSIELRTVGLSDSSPVTIVKVDTQLKSLNPTTNQLERVANISEIPTPTVNAASGTKTIWTGTQSEYEAIDTKDANTLYFITEE